MASLRFQRGSGTGDLPKNERNEVMATKSQVVSWMGVSLSIIQGLMKEVQKLGGGDEHVRKLAMPDGESLLAELAQKLVGVVRRTFKVMVDYGKNLQEMIADGAYDYANPDITADHFPVKGEGKQEREVTLFHFNRSINSDNAIEEMAAAGYRPATIEEFLALGKAQPDLQRQFPIVALGSVWRGPRDGRRVPCLRGYDGKRVLYLDYYGGVWSVHYRFAAVRNA